MWFYFENLHKTGDKLFLSSFLVTLRKMLLHCNLQSVNSTLLNWKSQISYNYYFSLTWSLCSNQSYSVRISTLQITVLRKLQYCNCSNNSQLRILRFIGFILGWSGLVWSGSVWLRSIAGCVTVSLSPISAWKAASTSFVVEMTCSWLFLQCSCHTD